MPNGSEKHSKPPANKSNNLNQSAEKEGPTSAPDWQKNAREEIEKGNRETLEQIQNFFADEKNKAELAELGLTDLKVELLNDGSSPNPESGEIKIESDSLKNVHGEFKVTCKYKEPPKKKLEGEDESSPTDETEYTGSASFRSDGMGGGVVFVDPNNPASIEAGMALAKSLGVKSIKVSDNQSPDFKEKMRDACIKHNLSMNGVPPEKLKEEREAERKAKQDAASAPAKSGDSATTDKNAAPANSTAAANGSVTGADGKPPSPVTSASAPVSAHNSKPSS